MKKLVKDDYKFIAKVNPRWWPDLFANAESKIGSKEGDFVVLWSIELEQHFMVYNSAGKKNKLKRKCVLTNAFENVHEKNPGKKNYIVSKVTQMKNEQSLIHIF